MRLALTHRTVYAYDDDVTASYGLGLLTPRELAHQHVVEHVIDVRPAPADLRHDVDLHGNTLTYLQIDTPHRELVVEARGVVETRPPVTDLPALAHPWEDARPAHRRDVVDAWRALDFALASPSIAHSERAVAYARASLAPGRPLGEAALELMGRIHDDFRYDPEATSVTATVDDLLSAGAGVCQDFAQLMLAGLRGHGLAARYVSGYLATDPPPGKARVLGADATHAWVEVWVPGDGWLALDPTNDQPANERYVTVGWGREYAEVTPLKGVIYTEATTSTLSVAVDVVPA